MCPPSCAARPICAVGYNQTNLDGEPKMPVGPAKRRNQLKLTRERRVSFVSREAVRGDGNKGKKRERDVSKGAGGLGCVWPRAQLLTNAGERVRACVREIPGRGAESYARHARHARRADTNQERHKKNGKTVGIEGPSGPSYRSFMLVVKRPNKTRAGPVQKPEGVHRGYHVTARYHVSPRCGCCRCACGAERTGTSPRTGT